MGFTDIPVRHRQRRSWRNYKTIKLNYIKRTSRLALRKLKQKMIESGKIDIGIPIVPIDYTVMKVNKDGKLVMIGNYDISISFINLWQN